MTRPLRVAVMAEGAPSIGGAYAHARNMIDALAAASDGETEFVLVQLSAGGLGGPGAIGVRYGRLARTLDSLAARGPRWTAALRRLGLLGGSLDAKLAALGVDLAIFAGHSLNMGRLARTNYIATVLDVCHRDHPEFEEIRADRAFEARERYNAATLPRAVALLVDSPLLAEKVAHLYRIDPARILVAPYKPSAAVLRAAAEAPAPAPGARPYVLYPAQFWTHKNHAYLLEGLARLKASGRPAPDAVFCGSDKGALEKVRALAASLGLADQVRFRGFVPDAELAALYRGALALVMPTWFGPTNIPPLEAMALGCPVVVSDLPEFRTNYGQAALYCDLTDPESLAGHLARLQGEPALRSELAAAGQALVDGIEEFDYGTLLRPVLRTFAAKARIR